MKAKRSKPPTENQRKIPTPFTDPHFGPTESELDPALPKSVVEIVEGLKKRVGLIESLAANAAGLADQDKSENHHRLRNLAVQIGVAAGEAWKTACDLVAALKGPLRV